MDTKFLSANEAIEGMNEKKDYTFIYVPKKAGEHVSLILSLGRVFPITKAQAQKVARNGFFDVLNNKDVENIEKIMNKHGFNGQYKLTKSKTWVRLMNFQDFAKALKLEFGF